MINILLTGVGGQGTVLAAKLLASAANGRGWHVRTAETIGMAQRGGSVVSHVRMGDSGEEVCSPLIPKESADMIIAFEPSEGARCLPYLAPGGTLVTARTGIPAVSSATSSMPYVAEKILEGLRAVFANEPERFVVVEDDEILSALGNRRALNTVLLASALGLGKLPITVDDLRAAIGECVKPSLIDINMQAIDRTIGGF